MNDTDWITYTTTTFVDNRGSVILTIPEYDNSSGRSGIITIAGNTVSVSQTAAACAITGLTPASQSVAVGGGSYHFALSVFPEDCAWTVAANKSWITPATGGGTGDATVNYSASANATGNNRTGSIAVTLTKSGKKGSQTVHQSGK